ncbi:MAG: hypothetical protein ACR2IF_09750 [Terriglobales bacterium]
MKLFSLAFFLLIAMSTVTGADEKAVPLSQEPHHKLVFENDATRVWDVTVPAHESTLLHKHDHNYVAVVLGPARTQNAIAGKPVTSATVMEGEIRYVTSPLVHRVTNAGETPFHNFTIEILKKKPTPKTAQKAERGLDIGHGGLTDVAVDNDEVRVSEVQISAGGMLHKQPHPYPYLLVALTGLSLDAAPQGKPPVMMEQKDKTAKWFPAGAPQEMMNMGKQEARFIMVEFK